MAEGMNYDLLKIMIIGAHQDDAEECAGIAAKFARAGHRVRFLSATNGQSGHQDWPGAKTVRIRMAEMQRAAAVLGIEAYECLDINDGYLTAEIHNRERMMRAIREFAPDVIITHRPWDYHPDHKNTGILVQDCAYLLRVPNFLPTVHVVGRLPLIFYMHDDFQKPCAFQADLAIDIDDAAELKIMAFAQHESQMFDWLPWTRGEDLNDLPKDAEGRLDYLRQRYLKGCAAQARECRALLADRYGAERAENVEFCESLEACEYGASHEGVDYRRLFPF